jgi:two-component system, NtrC family, sensor histidine kinase GlrK
LKDIFNIRFPLFSKIIGAFVVIILFMISSSSYLLFTLKDTFTSKTSELRGVREKITLVEQADSTFSREIGAAYEYASTQHPSAYTRFSDLKSTFQQEIDSLHNLTERGEIRIAIDSLKQLHRAYAIVLEASFLRGTVDSANLHSMRLTMHRTLEELQDLYRYSFDKTLKVFEKGTANAFDGALFIIMLSLAVGLAIAFLLAHNVTKPIHALKAGTQKVAEGKFEVVNVTTRDEIADLTVAFNSMSDKLRQLDEMRMSMMSEISHEMRTPLQVIKAATYTISHPRDGTVLNQRQTDALGMISQSTNRISSFVNSFLDVAKLEAGLMKFNFEPTDLGELLQPIVSEAQLIGQTRGIAVELLSDSTPLIPIDKERMSMVFTNLLSNALKYTPEHGKITVRYAIIPPGDELSLDGKSSVKIDVQDTGVGIPPEDIDKLFNKFYQAKNIPQVKEKGSGLGLALVKHVIEAHGGKVVVTSTVGVGSTFGLILPVSQKDAPESVRTA